MTKQNPLQTFLTIFSLFVPLIGRFLPPPPQKEVQPQKITFQWLSTTAVVFPFNSAKGSRFISPKKIVSIFNKFTSYLKQLPKPLGVGARCLQGEMRVAFLRIF